MTDESPPSGRHAFFAREKELAVLDGLLRATMSGAGGALVIRGESGVGKTELLNRGLAAVPELRRLSVVGRESETELSFTALHELCSPIAQRLESLAEPQRMALEVAFAMRHGAEADPFRLGIAVLGLMSAAATRGPIVCVVDDAQWIDRASADALVFAARRLKPHPVAILFAVRDGASAETFAGFPILTLRGLRHGAALELLASRLRAPLDPRIRDQIIAEARGNPQALLELSRRTGPGELAGGYGLPDAVVVPRQIEDDYRVCLMALPPLTQKLLLVAAADPLGEVTLLWDAAGRLGITPEAVAPAEAAGLVELGVRVRFDHPLARSAIYGLATPEDRRTVHRALAEAVDPRVDADRRAWHHARSTVSPDETVARKLERSADRASAHGGLAAAALFLERATALTPDPARRAARSLAAARLKHRAGADEAATGLLPSTGTGSADDRQCALADRLSAQIAANTGRDAEAPARLLAAARLLEPLDRQSAYETYIEAIGAGTRAGGRADPGLLAEIARAARAALTTTSPADFRALALRALSTRVLDGHAAAVPSMRAVVSALRDGSDEPDWLWLMSDVAADVWEEETWRTLCERSVGSARRTGDLVTLPGALHRLMLVHIHGGEFSEAAELAEETHGVMPPGVPSMAGVILGAWRGEQISVLAKPWIEMLRGGGAGRVLSVIDYANAVLHNGLGRYDVASQAAHAASRHDELGAALTLREEVEAAARCGRRQAAETALGRLVERTETCGTDWALGVQLCSRAVLGGPEAESRYQEAVDRLRHTRAAVHLARAHLLYGEWLRREARREDARRHLRIAHEMLTTIGAAAFAGRAARELASCGDGLRKRATASSDRLTERERQIAVLVADGATSKETAEQLFLSPRTVDAHLRNIFKKFGLTSRRQLRDLRRERPVDFLGTGTDNGD
jgi:DNA-binding CsgD family transcriptional regulator